jgi:hypothetical protein
MTALKNGNYNFTVLFSYLEDFPTFKTVLLFISHSFLVQTVAAQLLPW